MDSWRAGLLSGSRGKNVNDLFMTLKTQLPNSNKVAPRDIWKMATRSERKICSSATSQLDYWRRISLKLQLLGANSSRTSGHTGNRSSRDYFGWTFALSNIILEALSAVSDELSSPNKPQFALVGLLTSFVALILCAGEFACKAYKAKVTARRWGRVCWFFYPPPEDRPFGTFPGIFGSVSAVFQCAFSIIQYVYCRQHSDNPIKISVLPFLLAICVAGSRFLHPAESRLMIPTTTEEETVSLPLAMEDRYIPYMFGNSI